MLVGDVQVYDRLEDIQNALVQVQHLLIWGIFNLVLIVLDIIMAQNMHPKQHYHQILGITLLGCSIKAQTFVYL